MARRGRAAIASPPTRQPLPGGDHGHPVPCGGARASPAPSSARRCCWPPRPRCRGSPTRTAEETLDIAATHATATNIGDLFLFLGILLTIPAVLLAGRLLPRPRARAPPWWASSPASPGSWRDAHRRHQRGERRRRRLRHPHADLAGAFDGSAAWVLGVVLAVFLLGWLTAAVAFGTGVIPRASRRHGRLGADRGARRVGRRQPRRRQGAGRRGRRPGPRRVRGPRAAPPGAGRPFLRGRPRRRILGPLETTVQPRDLGEALAARRAYPGRSRWPAAPT